MARKAEISAGLLVFRRRPNLEVLLGHPGGPYWARKDDGARRRAFPEIDRVAYFGIDEAMRKILAYQHPLIRELVLRLGET
jgi:predicted NUDIX family NTP pyrophosphohydrolase